MFQMWWLNSGFLILEHVLSRRRSYEAEKRRGGVQRAHAELWVSLQTGKVGVDWAYASVFRVKENIRHETIHELFSSNTCICSSFPSLPTNLLQPIHIRMVHFIPMSMPLPYLASPAVQRPCFRPGLAPLLKHGRPQPKTHCVAHMRSGYLGHKDDKTGCFALASNSPDMAPSKLSTFSLILPRQAGTRGRCPKTGFWTRARTLWRASCLLIRAGRTRPGQEFRKPPPTSS